MSCLHPKVAFQIWPVDYKPGDPKPKLHFIQSPGQFDLNSFDFKAHFSQFPRGTRLSQVKHYVLPCGQCVECRLQKSREMADRIMLEAKQFNDNWSVTLTYDEISVPKGDFIFDNDGVALGRMDTLVPAHVTAFNKALRQYFSRKFGHHGIRFYCAGEYGSKGGRPHYHLIYFNLPLPADDVALCKNEASQTGEDLFESKILSSLWGKGRVRLNVLTWQYAAYCARYIMKKQTGKKAEVYSTLGIAPEFTRCSNRPGLGFQYYLDHKDELLSTDKILIKQGDHLSWTSIPKYFLRKAEEDGEDLEELKKKRQSAASAGLQKTLGSISQDYFAYLQSIEEELKNRSKSLPRNGLDDV